MSATHAALMPLAGNGGFGTPLGAASSPASQAGAGAFSVGCFVRMDSKAFNIQAMLSKWGTTHEWMLFYANGPDAFSLVALDSGGTAYQADGTTSPAIGTWYSIWGVHDPVNGLNRLYVNAVQEGSVACSAAIRSASSAFEIGAVADGTTDWSLDGRVAMAVKYSFALTPTQITWFHNGGSGRSTAEILAQTGLTTPDFLYGFDSSGSLGTDSSTSTLTLSPLGADAPTQTTGPGSGGPTTATVTGPTALSVGTTSGSYTITLPAPSVGDTVFTPAPSGFSATPTPPTVTIADGMTTATFVLDPLTAGTGAVSATSPGITVTGQSGVTVTSTGITAGTLTAGTVTPTTAAGSIATNSAGVPPYSNQLRTSPPGANTWTPNGSPVAGATASLTATGLTPSTSYDLQVLVNDVNLLAATSNTVAVTTPAVVATTFTLTGPSVGTVNMASGNFTVRPDGLFSGTITITPSGGGLSTPIVKTFVASADPQDFTITPTATGTVTLAPTNSGGLANPASVTYLSSPQSVTTTTWQTGVGDFDPGLVGGVTAGFGYKVGLNGGSFGSLVTSGIVEDAPGSYSAQVAVAAGNIPRMLWFEGAGDDGVADYAPISLPGAGGGSGGFPNPAPVNWLNLAAVADDLKVDGTMRASSSGGVVHFDPADRIANGATGTVTVNQYLMVVDGTGLGGPLVPIATASGSSGARDGTVPAGSPDPGLDATTRYIWTSTPTTVDLAQPLPIRDQRGVTDPNIGDSLAVIHAMGAAGQAKDLNARTLTLKAADGTILMVFDLDNATNPNVRTPRSS